MPDRAPVQAGRFGPAGTISWAEHERVWEAYSRRYGNRQSAERIAERGGFGHGEILELTGGLPQTFVRNPHSTYPCDTPGCPGDGRYAAPGKGHLVECRFPLDPQPTEQEPKPATHVCDWACYVDKYGTDHHSTEAGAEHG